MLHITPIAKVEHREMLAPGPGRLRAEERPPARPRHIGTNGRLHPGPSQNAEGEEADHSLSNGAGDMQILQTEGERRTLRVR